MRNNCLCFCLLIIFQACSSYSENVKIDLEQPVLPVLTMKDINTVLIIRLIKTPSIYCEVKKIALSLNGTTDIKDIESVSLFDLNQQNKILETVLLGYSEHLVGNVIFKDKHLIKQDTMTFGISVKLKKE